MQLVQRRLCDFAVNAKVLFIYIYIYIYCNHLFFFLKTGFLLKTTSYILFSPYSQVPANVIARMATRLESPAEDDGLVCIVLGQDISLAEKW